MTKSEVEEMFAEYGVEGKELAELVEKDLKFSEEISKVFEKTIGEMQQKIDSNKRLEKAEKILKKKKRK